MQKPSLLILAFLFFLGGGTIMAFFALRVPSPAHVAEQTADLVAKELRRASDDLEKYTSLSSEGELLVGEFNYALFVFEGNRLAFWSDNNFVPSYQQVADTFDVRFLNIGSETYLVSKKVVANDRFVISAIPLLRKYPITNDYLQTEFNGRILPSANVTLLDVSASLGTPVCVENKCLFRISFLPNNFPFNVTLKIVAVLFLSCALIIVVYLLIRGAWKLSRRKTEYGLVLLIGGLVLLRLLVIESGWPRTLLDIQLFNPQIFAASYFNPSLGDLLLNVIALFLVALYVFRNYTKSAWIRGGYQPSYLSATVVTVVLLFAGLFPVVFIQTLYNNSTLVLDVKTIFNFDYIRFVAFLSVILAGITSFLFSHAALRMLVGHPSLRAKLTGAVIGVIVFIIINEATGQMYQVSLAATVVFVSVVVLLKLYKKLNRLSFETFGYLFIAILLMAVNGAIAVNTFGARQKIQRQFKFASNFLIDRDAFTEFLLFEASQKIRKDIFIQTRLTNPFLGKDAIRQKIRQIYLPSYFNKYDIEIFLFNGRGAPLDKHGLTFPDYVSQYETEAFKTAYEGIRFVNNPSVDVAQRYIIICPIGRSHTNGFVAVELSLKKIIPENVYPELLVDYRFQQMYRTEDISYAVWIGGKMAYTSGEFNYSRSFPKVALGNPALFLKGWRHAGHDHVAVEDETGRVAVVSSKSPGFSDKLSAFSLLLTMGLFTVLVMIFTQGVYMYFKGTRLFFTARIQLYLNLAFFVPLIVVSVTTLNLTTKSSQQQLNQEYINKSRILGQQVLNLIEDQAAGLDDPAIPSAVTDLAHLSNLDANVYDASGRLVATSQPVIFESNMVSSYLSPGAFYRIFGGENIFIESDDVGQLKYFVSYAALKSSQSGQLLGILAIPFFQSDYRLKEVQALILTNILNIFAFILIVLLLLSYIVGERLTFPLRFITQSLKRTSLNDHNTPLKWPANDEIGIMVKEYNSMLYKLAESKSRLAQTQREEAWREIAQQVAHEIKNPLTPMKLTLQQLERSVESGKNTPEKTEQAVKALLAQVDTLNEIASSFSGFAKMPEPVIQRLDLVELIYRVIDLHASTAKINFRPSVTEAWCTGDLQLLSRTFSNLIINAVQAERPGFPIVIDIGIRDTGKFYNISFADNGKGIDPSISERVFLPHFSTKKTGSGLGLAIARQGIEQMNGRIWFETTVGSGTTFFVECPKA